MIPTTAPRWRHALAAAAALALIVGMALALLVRTAHAEGSDSAVPYTLDVEGLTLAPGDTFTDGAHVNIRLTDGQAFGVHFEAKCATRSDAECAGRRHEVAQYVGASFLPWHVILDRDTRPTDCISWVQVWLYNEHYGEGGQPPLCMTPDYPSEPPTTDEPTSPPTTTEPPTTPPTDEPTEPTEPPTSTPPASTPPTTDEPTSPTVPATTTPTVPAAAPPASTPPSTDVPRYVNAGATGEPWYAKIAYLAAGAGCALGGLLLSRMSGRRRS